MTKKPDPNQPHEPTHANGAAADPGTTGAGTAEVPPGDNPVWGLASSQPAPPLAKQDEMLARNKELSGDTARFDFVPVERLAEVSAKTASLVYDDTAITDAVVVGKAYPNAAPGFDADDLERQQRDIKTMEVLQTGYQARADECGASILLRKDYLGKRTRLMITTIQTNAKDPQNPSYNDARSATGALNKLDELKKNRLVATKNDNKNLTATADKNVADLMAKLNKSEQDNELLRQEVADLRKQVVANPGTTTVGPGLVGTSPAPAPANQGNRRKKGR